MKAMCCDTAVWWQIEGSKMNKFWLFIWNTSELLNIPLGRFAPHIFAKMTGCKNYKKIEGD